MNKLVRLCAICLITGSLNANISQAAIYHVHPSDLASREEFSVPHGTGVNPFAYDWDSAPPSTKYGAPSGFGESSFYASVQNTGVTAADRYRTFRVSLHSLFGRNITVGELAEVSYQTRKEAAQTTVDWRVLVYTTHDPARPGNAASWYRSRLQSTPSLALNLSAPAAQWNQWSSSVGNNQLRFKDNRTGFTTENLLWSEIINGPVVRGVNTWNWTAEEILMIDIILGANSGGGTASSQLDVVQFRLTNGEIAVLDLQQVVKNHTIFPHDLATGKSGFSAPHGTGSNAFAYDWDSVAPDTAAGAPTGFGSSSFYANVQQGGATPSDRYRTFRVGLQSLFGRPITLGELMDVSYQTRKNASQTAVDWRLTVYTTHEPANPGNAASWYRSRIQSTPGLALSLNAPATQWNKWITGNGTNQLRFKDNRVGFTAENILWSEVTGGPVTRGTNTWNWTAEEVMMIDITLGANSGGGNAASQIDAVEFRLSNGEIAVMNFELLELPEILVQPSDVVFVHQGADATFSVVATNGTLAYQWSTNGFPIFGATDSSYTWATAQPADTTLEFSVEISNPTGTVGSDKASIRTVKSDSTAPIISVTSPVKNKSVDQALVNITGVIKDSGTISAVRFVHNEHNGGVVQDATFTPAGSGKWEFATAIPITLSRGTNTLRVWAVDLAGNVSTLSPFVFFYDVTSTLTLNIIGNGNVRFGQSIYSGPTTSIASVFKVGYPYKLDAYVSNGTNYVFGSWVTSPSNKGYSTNAWVKKASLSFVMQEDMVIDAKFLPNPFSDLAGSYNGLFSESNNVTHETAGFFQITVKDKATYSGHLFFDGFKRPFSGRLALDGTIDRTVTRTKFISQQPVQLSLNLTDDVISGTVSDANALWTSAVIGDKAVFSPSYPETTNAGKYTFQIPSSIGAPSANPGGVGYGTVDNNSLGVVNLSGALSDGEKIVQKVTMSRDGQWPFYVPLYKSTVKGYMGSLIGWLSFTNANFTPSNNVLTWIKKEGSTSQTRYGAGFSNSVEIVGSPYLEPAAGAFPVPLNIGDWIILRDGNLTQPVTNTITSFNGHKVNFHTTNTLGVVSAGSIGFRLKSGSFYPMYSSTIQGVVLQNATNASGFFFGPTETGTVDLKTN